MAKRMVTTAKSAGDGIYPLVGILATSITSLLST
jgi:hypothetical protein